MCYACRVSGVGLWEVVKKEENEYSLTGVWEPSAHNGFFLFFSERCHKVVLNFCVLQIRTLSLRNLFTPLFMKLFQFFFKDKGISLALTLGTILLNGTP